MATDSPRLMTNETSSRMVSCETPVVTCLVKPLTETILDMRTLKAFWLQITLTAFTALGFIGPAQAQQPVLLVLGDSLSAGYGLPQGRGWVDLLRNKLEAEGYGFKVVNASISGETTLGGRNRLPALLTQHKPAIVVLELGANDALRGTDLTVTRANLKTMSAAALAANAKLAVIGMRIPPNYGPDYTRKFFALFGEIAAEHRAQYVPFLLEGFAERREMFQDDGIHPKSDAQPIMMGTVFKALQPLLEAKRATGKAPLPKQERVRQ